MHIQTRSYIDAHQALMSPVRQLPAETLSEIFVKCLPTEKPPVRSLEEAPLLLTSVCRRWRAIAIETPRLWNSLHIFLPSKPSPQVHARRAEGTTMWLARSGSLSLCISVCINEPYKTTPLFVEVERVVPELLFRSLLQFSHRFARLSLALGSENFASLESLSPVSFPALTAFTIDVINRNRDHSNGADNLFFAPFIERLPALQRLKIRSFGGLSGTNYATLPCNWQNLTELSLLPDDDSRRHHMGILTNDNLLSILTQMPRLEPCHALISQLTRLSPIAPTHSVHLPSLHTMWLETGDESPLATYGAHISHVLHAISAPRVKTLSISWKWNMFNPEGFTSPPFPPMRSLKRLALKAPMTSSALTECLAFVPNLTVLEVLDLGFYSITGPHSKFHHTVQTANFAQLSDGNDIFPSLCPQLEALTLIVRNNHINSFTESGNHWELRPLLRFLESRRPHSHFECCDVLLSADRKAFPEEVLEGLERLKQSGLNLRIRCYDPHPKSRDSPTSGIGVGDLSHSSPEVLLPLNAFEETLGAKISEISTVVRYGTFDLSFHLD